MSKLSRGKDVLTITQVNYIRDLYFLEGKNITEICNLTGRNCRTIKKYIEQDDFNSKEHKVKRPNKSDVLRPIINKWLTEDKFRHHKQKHTAKRIYDRLKEEYPDLLKVSERTVRRIGETVVLKIMANKIEILTKDLSTKITQHPRLFERGQESINYIDFIDIIKLRPNALKYLSIYSLLPTSWQDYLKSLDKESHRQAFDVLRMILLEEDMDYADKVLKETLKHKSIFPEAVEITYKRFKEDHTLFESTIYFPEDLPPYQVDINQYDHLLLGSEGRGILT